MLPAYQLGHGDFVAIRFEQQTAQHVGDLAAKFARMDRVTPEFADAFAGGLSANSDGRSGATGAAACGRGGCEVWAIVEAGFCELRVESFQFRVAGTRLREKGAL